MSVGVALEGLENYIRDAARLYMTYSPTGILIRGIGSLAQQPPLPPGSSPLPGSPNVDALRTLHGRGVQDATVNPIPESIAGTGPKPFVPSRPDFGGPRAHGVGSEQQRRAEARNIDRGLAYNEGGEVAPEYLYGVGPEGSGIGQLLSSLLPVRREVIEPFREEFIESADPGQMERVVTPGEYGEVEFAVPEAVQAFLNFKGLARDPEARRAVMQGLASLPGLPEEISRRLQISTQAAMSGQDEVYDPVSGGTVTASEALLMTPLLNAPGTAASIARAGDQAGTVFGMLFGSKAKGPLGDKVREAEQLAKAGKSDQKISRTTGASRTTENKFVVATPFKGPRGLELKESLREGGPTGFIEKFYMREGPDDVRQKLNNLPQATRAVIQEQTALALPGAKNFAVLEDFIEFKDFFEAYPEARKIPVLPTRSIPDVGEWAFMTPPVQFDPLNEIFYIKAQKHYGKQEDAPDVELSSSVYDDSTYGSPGRTNFAFALQSYVNHKEGLVLPKGALTTDPERPFAGELSEEATSLKRKAEESAGLQKRAGRISRSALENQLEMKLPALTEELTMPEIYERRKRAIEKGVRTSDEGFGNQYVDAVQDVYGFPPPAGDTRALGAVEDLVRKENLTLPMEMGSLVSDLPFNTNLGSFESKLLVNARNLKQEKIGDPKPGKSGPTSGDRYAELLQKTSSAEELELSGILSWLRGRRGVTKPDLVFELEKRSVPIRQLDTGTAKDAQLEFQYGIAEEDRPILDPRSKPQNTGTIEFVTDPDRRFVDELGSEIDLPRGHGMSKNNFGWLRHSQRAFQDDKGALRRPTLVIEEIQSDIHQKAKADQGTLLQSRVRRLLRDGMYPGRDRNYGSREVEAENYNDQVTKPAAAQTIAAGFAKFKEAFVERSRKQGTSEDVIQAGLEEIDNDLRKALSQIDTDPDLQAVNALDRGARTRELDFILPAYVRNDAALDSTFFLKEFEVRKIEQMRRSYPELSDRTYQDIYDPRFKDEATGIKGVPFAPFRTQWHKMAIQAALKEALEEDLGGLALTTTKGSGQKAGKPHSQYDNEYLNHLKEIAKRFNLRLEPVDRTTNTGGLALIQKKTVFKTVKPDIRYHYLYLDNPEADLEGLEEFLRTPIRTSGKVLAKAMGGGVGSLAPIARNMYKIPSVKRGVGSYISQMRR